MIAEYDNSGTLLRKFIYGPGIDEPICMIVVNGGETKYYYHFDGLGSVIALSDVTGDIVERYSYDVFGAVTIRDSNNSVLSESSVANPYMFTARAYDVETGLYYYRARYYKPSIGRFLQSDPIGYDDGLNIYTYCHNNPIRFVDPVGEGVYKWIYTGDWDAPDEVYRAAVDAAGECLIEISPIRATYLSGGGGKRVGGSITVSLSMDSGISVAARGRLRVGSVINRVGGEGGIKWKPGNGFKSTKQVSFQHAGVHVKYDDEGNVKLGINYGIAAAGFVIAPSYFDNLYNAWCEILPLDSVKSCPHSNVSNEDLVFFVPADPVDVDL